ncbi:hypothetical protein [Streptomyces sp. NPDC040750]|uniref:hypothetical protein n=1 Tax=Streptomyces sp. NPDC040750 TaxID=3154491 RepID=UPI0033E2324E
MRYLHRLFEDEHLTVARLIQRHRLQMCSREPAGGDGASRAVSTVAQRAAGPAVRRHRTGRRPLPAPTDGARSRAA